MKDCISTSHSVGKLPHVEGHYLASFDGQAYKGTKRENWLTEDVRRITDIVCKARVIFGPVDELRFSRVRSVAHALSKLLNISLKVK